MLSYNSSTETFMQKLQTTIFYTILASEAGHVVCCVIPTVLSLLALAASYGLMVSIPGFALSIHEYMHEWEQTVIIISGLLLAFGWALHALSKKIEREKHDCCSQTKCAGKKNKAEIIMLAASALFIMNVAVYTFVHTDMNANFEQKTVHEHSSHS
jgi:hypothetical protein